MIIYWSMIAWVPLMYFIYCLKERESTPISISAPTSEYAIVVKKVPIIFAILIFGYFIFWAGERWYVADTTQYISTYESIPLDFSAAWSSIEWKGSKAPLFDAIQVIFKCFISSDCTAFLMFVSTVSGVAVMIPLRKYSVDFFYSSYLFMTLLTFSWMFNGMRQFICVSILFLCSDLIKNGKWVSYIIAVIILSYIHMTAVLMIPVYFVARAKPWKTRTFIFLIAIILISVFSGKIFGSVDNLLSDTAYVNSVSQFESDDGVNPLRSALFAIPPVLAFVNRDKLECFYKQFPIIPICINMSVIACGLYFVGIFTSGVLIGRLPVYAEVYDLILIPFLIESCFNERNKLIAKAATIIVTLAYFYLLWGGNSYHSHITGLV